MNDKITIKTPDDIELLRKGGRLLAGILDQLEELAVPGNSSLDIDQMAVGLLAEAGLKPTTLGHHPEFALRPYPATTCVSTNSQVVHGIPNEVPMTFTEGDVVSIDLVIGYQNMILDSARSVGVGRLSEKSEKLLQVTRTALNAGIQVAKEGNRVNDIGRAIEKNIPKGFAIVRDFCGHGVGYELHEPPQVPNFYSREHSTILKAGMVLAIEPIIIAGDNPDVKIDKDGYTVLSVSGEVAAHMEHTVLITKNNPEVLTI